MKMQANAMFAAADEASGLLKALANRHRLIIICQLIEKERSVGELAALLKIRHSTVSQHLALLRKDGLVTARRDGQTIWYSIGSPQARALVRTVYRRLLRACFRSQLGGATLTDRSYRAPSHQASGSAMSVAVFGQ